MAKQARTELVFRGNSLEKCLDIPVCEHGLTDTDIIFVESKYNGEWAFSLDMSDPRYHDVPRKCRTIFNTDEPSYAKYWEQINLTPFCLADGSARPSAAYERLKAAMHESASAEAKSGKDPEAPDCKRCRACSGSASGPVLHRSLPADGA